MRCAYVYPAHEFLGRQIPAERCVYEAEDLAPDSETPGFCKGHTDQARRGISDEQMLDESIAAITAEEGNA